MKKLLFGLCLFCVGSVPFLRAEGSGRFVASDDFVAYLKRVTNPHEFGLRDDGRFYPYSTPRGRRIGYAEAVTNKLWYQQGLTKGEAEAQLRAAVERAADDVAGYLEKPNSAKPFSRLSRKSQEMLVDVVFTEGTDKLPPAFCEAVIHEKWDKLFNELLYVRWVEKGWPDTPKNKAFADRWLPSVLRERPQPAGSE